MRPEDVVDVVWRIGRWVLLAVAIVMVLWILFIAFFSGLGDDDPRAIATLIMER